jgi:predicted RNA-binding Zn-ribbon protein involved in translation (DUF1610 family)
MAKIKCFCGTTLSLSGEIPNPIEWKLVSDKAFDRFSGSTEVEVIYRLARSMFVCPTCGRLWVYWDGIDKRPSCYRSEEVPKVD